MRKGLAILSSAIFAIAAIQPVSSIVNNEVVSAAEASYPLQEFRIGIADTNRNVNISGSDNGSLLNSWTTNGERNEKWTLNYISDGVYEIVNSATGYIITNNNGNCVIAKDEDKSEQRWKIVGVEKDFEGQYLYYKIVSNSNNNQALTFNPNTNTFNLNNYSGDLYQKFKINCDGLDGFAANCKVEEGEKAGTIGGLLGKTVFVSDLNSMKSALTESEPLTIVLTANIDCSKENYDWRIASNKTIVGSYAARQMKDCKLRTNDYFGVEEISDNIIIRNINFQVEVNPNMLVLAIYSSRNVWVDHCTFNSDLDKNRNEVGKFIWINTPFDGKDLSRSPDYITLSYNIFRNRYWTIAYGTQNGEVNHCRTSVMYNWWDKCIRRCPQIGNGTGHIYNNYHSGVDSGIVDGTAQLIPGEGSVYYSENCRFEALKGVEAAIDKNAKYRDSGSYTSDTSTSTPYPLSNNLGNYTSHNWNPATENYGYKLIDAYNTKNTDIKSFCKTYSGCFNSYNKIKYISDSDMSNFVTKTYTSPFLKQISTGVTSTEKTGAVMDTSIKYMFKNVNSGLYMEVDGGKAENGANVQQWGADTNSAHNTWKLIDAGDGYYYIRSCVGDGKTYFLDLDCGKTDNGTNIGIYENTKSDAQLFKFVDNGDGTYTITTKVTKDGSCIGIASDSTSSGASAVQWSCNGENSQKWIVEKITEKDGAVLDTNKCYMLKNVNSGLYMEVDGGKTENGANVQQWGADVPSAHNVWHLKYVDWGYYYIYSAVGDGETFVLNVNDSNNGSNITINENIKKSSQYFKFVDNEDGTYTIVTRASRDSSCVEIADSNKGSGGNVQQYECNNLPCQKWELIPVDYTLPSTITTTTTKVTTVSTTTSTTLKSTTTTSEKEGAILDSSKCYMLKNVNSGLYMEVDGGKTENGANVQQWGADVPSAHNVWHLKYVDWGYYYIYSAVGDGETFVLNVNDSSNGSNITINENIKNSSQYFKFIDNGDGTYTIVTRASRDSSCVEIADANKGSGGNVQQYECNNLPCQKWELIPVDYTLPSTITTTTTKVTTINTTTTTIKTTISDLPYENDIIGDVNVDNKVNLTDVIYLNKYIAGSYMPSEQGIRNANCDQSNPEIDLDDTLALLKYLIKLLSLPVK